MSDELSPTVFALLFSSFTLIGGGLIIYFIELPVDVLNTSFGAFAVALVLAAFEFFIFKRAITE